MNKINLDGVDLLNMIEMGLQRLQDNKARINGLNVFPVPDGDTGTNMHMTLQSGIMEMRAKASHHLGQSAEALSRGLLLGARGNSGVILSQLFRGFSKSVSGLEQADAKQISSALQQGVECAYKAVVKPVEGTILTVAKQAALHTAVAVTSTEEIVELFEGVQQAAQEALNYTPEQLPILKQVGVVDAGGQGLLNIYEGFVQALSGEIRINRIPEADPSEIQQSMIPHLHLASEHIEYGYCTEFIIKLKSELLDSFNEHNLRDELSKLGDSLVVVADNDLVKVHIHAEQPGSVMNHVMQFGDLTGIKIENMREQHAHLIQEEPTLKHNKVNGMLAVAIGEGISDVFRSLGVDIVLEGGQSMNPSTEDILLAVNRIPADVVFILPNNSNIVLAAKQAAQLAGKEVVIIPSITIPQGLAAALTFTEHADIATNEEAMMSAIGQVRSGSVTFATRNSIINQLDIQENDFLGMMDNQLIVADPNPQQTIEKLLRRIIERGDEVVTLFCGKEADPEWTGHIQQFIEQQYPDVELEIHNGGQPLYYYIISAE